MVLSFSSCAVSELDLEYKNSNEPVPTGVVAVKSSNDSSSDSFILLLSDSQSDQGAILSNQIIFKNGRYSLIMSKDEARMLGLNDSVYNYFSELVKSLNAQDD